MVIDWKQIVGLFILAIPIACVARTVVFEEIFKELREYCQRRSVNCRSFLERKFFYLFTCEYCFSHWVTVGFLILTALGPGRSFHLLYPDWRGTIIAFFALVFVANAYMNLYSRLRIDITSEKKVIEVREKESTLADREIQAKEKEIRNLDAEFTGRQDEDGEGR